MHVGTSDLDVAPLCLGGNPFGWTADEATRSPSWMRTPRQAATSSTPRTGIPSTCPAISGGESETIIGRWLKARGNRDRMVIATKVGALPGLDNLAPKTIRRAAEDSLRRLGTDHIDLYYSHVDDPDTPLAETLARVRRAGARRHGAAHRGVELHRGPAHGVAANIGAGRVRGLRRAAGGIQPGAAGGLRTGPGTHCGQRRAGLPALRRTGPWLPHRANTVLAAPRWTAPAPDRPAPTSTATARPCWPPWTRSPPRTAPPWPRLHSPGSPPSPPSPPRSPGPAIRPNSPICSRS